MFYFFSFHNYAKENIFFQLLKIIAHNSTPQTIEAITEAECHQILLPFPFISRLIFSRFLDFRGNLENVKEKQTRKTCVSREIDHPALRTYLAKSC